MNLSDITAAAYSESTASNLARSALPNAPVVSAPRKKSRERGAAPRAQVSHRLGRVAGGIRSAAGRA